MALPIVPLGTGSVTIGGSPVDIRSLSRAEALRLNGYRGREDEAEVFILMAGTGCTEAEAQEFREETDVDTAGVLIDAILVLSGLASDNPKTPASPTTNEPS